MRVILLAEGSVLDHQFYTLTQTKSLHHEPTATPPQPTPPFSVTVIEPPSGVEEDIDIEIVGPPYHPNNAANNANSHLTPNANNPSNANMVRLNSFYGCNCIIHYILSPFHECSSICFFD